MNTGTKHMKTLVTALLLALLIVPAEAKKRKGGKAQREANKKAQMEKKKEKEERENRRDAIAEFLKRKDGNKDGSLTLDEYLADEPDKEAATKTFEQYNKNRDRYLSKSEIQKMLGL